MFPSPTSTLRSVHPCYRPSGVSRPPLAPSPALGNLLRGGDTRGYNSLARMYTIDHANAKVPAGC